MLGKLTATSNPTERARILASQLSLLHRRLSELAATPVPHDKASNVPAVAPWATSRSAFINWAAEKKAAPPPAAVATTTTTSAAAASTGSQLPEDVVVEKFQEEASRTGDAQDAKVRERERERVKMHPLFLLLLSRLVGRRACGASRNPLADELTRLYSPQALLDAMDER